MDKMSASGETRVFGRNSDSIFKELDQIRKKQITLAVEHISLENLPDEEMSFAKEPAEDSEENFKKNSEQFAKKEYDLNNLMTNLNNLIGKLEDLVSSKNPDGSPDIGNPNINPLESDKCKNSSIVSDVEDVCNIRNPPSSSSTFQPVASSSFKDSMKEKYDLSFASKPSAIYDSRPLINIVPANSSSENDAKKSINDDNNIFDPPIINIVPTKSSLPVKINQSKHDESLITVPHILSNPSSSSNVLIPSSTKPSVPSLLDNKFRRNRSSTIVNMSSFSKPKSSDIGNSLIANKDANKDVNKDTTKQPRKRQLKRMGSAPTLNIPFMSMTKNFKIPSTKSMTNLNELEAKSDSETPKQYLERMMYSISRSKLVTIIAQKTDTFHQSALKAYMESFEFEKVPIDLALRKLLMDCNLPKETQQIDRVIEAFAKRYHESNPDLFPSADTPYILAFSLLMLHTDAYNKSVRRKMTKEEFVKNTRIDGVNPEILEILYDNITFAQFIYAQDDTDVNGQTMLESPTQHRQMKFFSSKERRKSSRPRNDPYWVIQTKLPTEFKPKIKDIVPTENPYSYMGTLPALDIADLHRAFSAPNTIRITGVQNRRKSHAFKSTSSSFQSTNEDGTFLLKITKSGKLGRKVDLIDGKKKSSFIRSWRIYGVILSGSQLMFFKDEAGFNAQMKKLKNSEKSATLPVLKPDAILMTADSVAVYDKNYEKYKNVFRLVCPKGHQYLFQAESDAEMNDWISKINYGATFKTAGLKMRNIRNPSVGQQRRGTTGNGLRVGVGMFGLSHDAAAKEAQGRVNLVRAKIDELQGKISALTSQLQTDIRFRNNLFLMIPYKASTRDRILQVATSVASRLKHTCLELSRLVCYNEILEKDLCSTVMEDTTYWQNRRSYFTPGDNSTDDTCNSFLFTSTNFPSITLGVPETFGQLFVKEPISSSNKLLDPAERDAENNLRPATMALLPCASTTSLSSNSSTGGSSRSTLSINGDNEEEYDFHGNVSEYELEIFPRNGYRNEEDRDDISFRDDASSIIMLDDIKEQSSLVNKNESEEYEASLIDIETEYNGECSYDKVEINVVEPTKIISPSSLENEKESKSVNETFVPKDQLNISQIQLDLKPESTTLDLGIKNKNEVTVPVLVISTVEEESKDEVNDGYASDDGGDQFVDAEEWGS
ncbi:5563_t:CDS:10 [Scutellospora calospora]|uniref:5563_t:CDS:1 n=1 Tax=Scutellospora calospora TaxID=85575 RepID=A0ACA9JWR1_9GLOM|nr:5563_t:CDS:10 [Scutellospora calospora]